MDIEWGPNWEDNLAGAPEHALGDPDLEGLGEQVKLAYEQAFMFYLPRICEHCLNPSCVASCPSGAMYKREEDGIVLVDQDKCRGWRFCVSGCPYKKVYFNHHTGKAEKCTLCYPRIEAGSPRSARRPASAASATSASSSTTPTGSRRPPPTPDPKDLLEAQLASSSTRTTPRCRPRRAPTASPTTGSRRRGARRCTPWRCASSRRAAAAPRVPHAADGLVRAAALAGDERMLEGDGYEADPDDVFPAIDELRIPLDYLANLLSAGDEAPVRLALKRLAAMRERYVIPEGPCRKLAGPPADRQGGGGFPQPLAKPTGSTTFIPLEQVGRSGS